MGKIEVKIDDFDLSKLPLLSCLSEQEMAVFHEQGDACSFDPGDTILKRGESDKSVYFMIHGRAHVLNYSSSGRAVTYASAATGEMFGEMAAIDGLPRSAWVCAISYCELIKIREETFMGFVKNNSDFAISVLRKLSRNIRELDKRLINILSLGAEQRVCIEIISMAEPDPEAPGRYRVLEMPTHSNFANLIGSSRETVSRVLSRLKTDRLITFSNRGLEISDRKKLENRAFGQSP
ncbi:Crp/Fnr family transcriptional regulator [Candidatus Puniceispirillum sp.]|nr:Crp/Fnr family transcriptional regulator [Candidatus Puniceispirillum sp.]